MSRMTYYGGYLKNHPNEKHYFALSESDKLTCEDNITKKNIINHNILYNYYKQFVGT